ncbi:hypothetical protein M378DRAFT_167450 [Amanita muscaria Koide BX008]|uniref:Uncharacterized protein n=1 Tax=Amanita muscaria (strain Koide BX008) TaxID=946122 RepID=A0A0C2SDJ8_AMAMK|nr:hypothetical protein M378DRAFT_167450 [Amanita muscaria Koide BX008]
MASVNGRMFNGGDVSGCEPLKYKVLELTGRPVKERVTDRGEDRDVQVLVAQHGQMDSQLFNAAVESEQQRDAGDA